MLHETKNTDRYGKAKHQPTLTQGKVRLERQGLV